jgi:hypothetical protein
MLQAQQLEDARAQDIIERHKIAGPAFVSATPTPRRSRKLRRWAEESRKVGSALTLLQQNGLAVLHDRSIPGTDGNIEHFVVGNQGIVIVRAAPFKGRIRTRKNDVHIGGNNVTIVVNGLLSRVDTVRHMVGGECDVQGALCLMDHKTHPKMFGKTMIGSTQGTIEELAQMHASLPPRDDIAKLANDLDTIFLPATLLT